MKYEDLLKAHLMYGTTKEDIIKKNGYEKVLENVIIAPWWSHTIFENFGLKFEQVNDLVFNCYSKDLSFSFIELKRIGAPAVADFFLSLGVTKCKRIIFLGSAGSLCDDIKIGDIVIPKYSICGDGASRYLNKNLEDEFGKFEYPYGELSKQVSDICIKNNISYMSVPNISVDTIFSQFPHINKIKELGAKTIEMETALLFKCSNIMKIKTTAIFVISDNTVTKKSLYSGRTEEEKRYRKYVINNIVPKIIIKLLKEI